MYHPVGGKGVRKISQQFPCLAIKAVVCLNVLQAFKGHMKSLHILVIITVVVSLINNVRKCFSSLCDALL